MCATRRRSSPPSTRSRCITSRCTRASHQPRRSDMQGVDPKWIFYLGILVSIEQAIAGGTIHLTNVIPSAWIPTVTAWCSLLAFIGTTVMTGLTGFSSKSAGPLVAPTAPVPPAVKSTIILLAVIGGSLLMSHDTFAQTPRPKIGGPVGQVLDRIQDQQGSPDAGRSSGAGALGDNGSALAKLLAKPFQDIAKFADTDAASAATLATQIPALQDGHGQRCWKAMGTFTAVVKAHPIPVTLNAMTDLE